MKNAWKQFKYLLLIFVLGVLIYVVIYYNENPPTTNTIVSKTILVETINKQKQDILDQKDIIVVYFEPETRAIQDAFASLKFSGSVIKASQNIVDISGCQNLLSVLNLISNLVLSLEVDLQKNSELDLFLKSISALRTSVQDLTKRG